MVWSVYCALYVIHCRWLVYLSWFILVLVLLYAFSLVDWFIRIYMMCAVERILGIVYYSLWYFIYCGLVYVFVSHAPLSLPPSH